MVLSFLTEMLLCGFERLSLVFVAVFGKPFYLLKEVSMPMLMEEAQEKLS